MAVFFASAGRPLQALAESLEVPAETGGGAARGSQDGGEGQGGDGEQGDDGFHRAFG